MYRPLRKINFEPLGSPESLTKHEQNMSLKDMIERAERGILDLSMYNTASEYTNDTSDPDSISEDDFSGNDRFFGQDLESAESELELQLTRAERKKRKSQAKPREDSERSKEDEVIASADERSAES